jgi:hypothetical protein
MWPFLLVGWLSLAVVLAVMVGELPRSLLTWQMVGVAVVMVPAAVLFGATVGQAVRRALTVPVAGMVLFLWLIFGPAATGLGRYLTPTFLTCCTYEEQPVSASIWAMVVLASVCAAGCLLVLRTGLRGVAVAVALVVVVGAGVQGAAATAGPDPKPDAVQARTTRPVCTTQQAITVCVWPENADRLPSTASTVVDTVTRLRRVGISLPTTFSESSLKPAQASRISSPPWAPLMSQRYSLIYALLPNPGNCTDERIGTAMDTALVWLQLNAGFTAANITSGPPEAIPRSVAITRWPLAQQKAWFTSQNAKFVANCGTPGTPWVGQQ